MMRPSKFCPEVRERAVRMVLDQQHKHDSHWAAITSIAEKDRLYRGDAAELGAAG
jgi:hypothetical protein